jgi:hypothetical protein
MASAPQACLAPRRPSAWDRGVVSMTRWEAHLALRKHKPFQKKGRMVCPCGWASQPSNRVSYLIAASVGHIRDVADELMGQAAGEPGPAGASPGSSGVSRPEVAVGRGSLPWEIPVGAPLSRATRS